MMWKHHGGTCSIPIWRRTEGNQIKIRSESGLDSVYFEDLWLGFGGKIVRNIGFVMGKTRIQGCCYCAVNSKP
jgi:hypothetical protein